MANGTELIKENLLFQRARAVGNAEPVKSELTPEQLAGIRYAITLGRVIQEEYPGIGDEFLQGISTGKIIRKHGLREKFEQAAESTLEVAVIHALKGWDGNTFGQMVKAEPYPGILPKEEYAARSKQIRFMCGKEMGNRMVDEKKGVHALTSKEKANFGRMGGFIGGPKGGKKTLELKIGIHDLNPEERAETLRLATEARGQTAWGEDELRLVEESVKRPKFQKQTKYRGVQPNYELLTAELNRTFHGGNSVRTIKAVRQRLYILRLEKAK